MRSFGGLGFRSTLHAVFGSLENRLVGALVTIMVCTLGLQAVSQDRATVVRDESDVLRAATGYAEHASQLVKSIGQFRLAALVYASSAKDRDGAGDELTNAAIEIGEEVN